jgi:hypothetical protein
VFTTSSDQLYDLQITGFSSSYEDLNHPIKSLSFLVLSIRAGYVMKILLYVP